MKTIINISQELKDNLSTWEKAKEAFRKEYPSNWIWNGLDSIVYEPITETNLDLEIVNIGETTKEQRDNLVKEMDKKGFRPLTISELVAVSVLWKEWSKEEYLYFHTLKEYSLDGDLQAPYFCLNSGDVRWLHADWCDFVWDGGFRFLFVRKSLELKSLDNASDTLTLELENAIKVCKANGIKLTREKVIIEEL